MNARNILHLYQWTQGHISSYTVAPFFRAKGACEWSDRHKISLVKCLFIFNCSWMHCGGGLNVPTDKNLNDWGQANGEVELRKLFTDRFWYGLILPLFSYEITLLIFAEAFKIHIVYRFHYVICKRMELFIIAFSYYEWPCYKTVRQNFNSPAGHGEVKLKQSELRDSSW